MKARRRTSLLTPACSAPVFPVKPAVGTYALRSAASAGAARYRVHASAAGRSGLVSEVKAGENMVAACG